MKKLNNRSIKAKIMLPIVILAVMIVLACTLGSMNAKSILNKGQNIYENCAKSIETLMDMAVQIEGLGKEMYTHLDTNDSLIKGEVENNIQSRMNDMQGLFHTFESYENSDLVNEYFAAMKERYNKYVNGLNEVLNYSSKGKNDEAVVSVGVIVKPSEDYISKKIDSLIEMKKQEMEAAIESQQQNYYKTIVYSIILNVVAVFMIAFAIIVCLKTIVTPIIHTSRFLEQLVGDIEDNKGDLSMRLKITSNDEIGKMGKSLNAFIDILEKVMKQITVSSQDMNQIVDEVGTRAIDATLNSNEISATMEELSASMQNVTETIFGINDHITEIGGSMQQLTDKSDGLLSYTERMENTATVLKNNAVENKQSTIAMTGDMITQIQKVIEDSKQVEKVKALTNEILEIASETNLLALNASIEAARAGEAGRGFAVVASEIGNLSDSSTKTAKNIQNINESVVNIVNELSQSTNDLVTYIQNNILPDYDSFVTAGIQYNDDAKHINGIVKEFNEMSTDLRKRTDRVELYVQDITKSVDESNDGIAGSALSTQNLAEQIHEISVRITHNKDVADLLSKEAEHFMI